MDCLWPLLFFGERHLKNLAIHTSVGVVGIAHLLLHKEWHWLEGAVQRHIYGVLELLVQIRLALLVLLLLSEAWSLGWRPRLIALHLIGPNFIFLVVIIFISLHIIFELLFWTFIGLVQNFHILAKLLEEIAELWLLEWSSLRRHIGTLVLFAKKCRSPWGKVLDDTL